MLYCTRSPYTPAYSTTCVVLLVKIRWQRRIEEKREHKYLTNLVDIKAIKNGAYIIRRLLACRQLLETLTISIIVGVIYRGKNI